jgi:hypothetical protein
MSTPFPVWANGEFTVEEYVACKTGAGSSLRSTQPTALPHLTEAPIGALWTGPRIRI